MKYIFGPVPSRRLGRSLGISPIPKKTCNYSCIYCQLGRTDKMTCRRQEFIKLEDILTEFDEYAISASEYDVVTIVGEGEPTLFSRLGELIIEMKRRTARPVAVITNGALLSDAQVRSELMNADIVLPSADAYDEALFKRIDRPHGSIDFRQVYEGLVRFSHEYKGQLFLELMLMDGINDGDDALSKYSEAFKAIRYDRLYINTPVRPPAEKGVNASKPESLGAASKALGGICIDSLASGCFFSEERDDCEAIKEIIGRHPMNQFEIMSFLRSRSCYDPDAVFARLERDTAVEKSEYKGYFSYRIK